MVCGVKFCGGCNPRYDRGKALTHIKNELSETDMTFENVREGVEYDLLLIIGGCSACCASFEQYSFKDGPVRMWDREHLGETILSLKDKLQ